MEERLFEALARAHPFVFIQILQDRGKSHFDPDRHFTPVDLELGFRHGNALVEPQSVAVEVVNVVLVHAPRLVRGLSRDLYTILAVEIGGQSLLILQVIARIFLLHISVCDMVRTELIPARSKLRTTIRSIFMHVLITGAAGLVGRRLTDSLQDQHELRLGDIQRIPNEPRWVEMDVTDPNQVQIAMHGVDAVIHLAIASGHEGDYEDEHFNQLRFDVQLKGTYNVLEAACREKVCRVVYTSSLTVVWGYDPPTWVSADAAARPVGTYALTKYLGEIICADYARAHGMSVVCLRIAKPVDLQDPQWKDRPLRPQWIAFPDLLQAYDLSLSAAHIDYEIFTIVGESSKRRWDLTKAERLLGYKPKYRLESLGYTLGDETESL